MGNLFGGVYLWNKGKGDSCSEGGCTTNDSKYPTTESSRLKGYYKVPFRDVHCETLRQWVASIILCHIVYRIDPPKLPELSVSSEPPIPKTYDPIVLSEDIKFSDTKIVAFTFLVGVFVGSVLFSVLLIALRG